MQFEQVLLGSAGILGLGGVQALLMGVDMYFTENAFWLGTPELDFFAQAVGLTSIANALLMYGISTNPTKSKKNFVVLMWLLNLVYQAGSNLSGAWTSLGVNSTMTWIWPIICTIMLGLLVTSSDPKSDPVPDTKPSEFLGWFYQFQSITFLINAVTNAIEPSIGLALYHPGYIWDTEMLVQAVKVFGFNFLLWGLYMGMLFKYESSMSKEEHLSFAGIFGAFALWFVYSFTLGLDTIDGVGASYLLFANWMVLCSAFAYICYVKAIKSEEK